VGINPVSTTTGSGTIYFIGRFDGTSFVADSQKPTLVDFGPDFYAANSWNGLATAKRLSVGWMNNWNYGSKVPTSPWRSAMTVPREINLRTVNGQLRLTQWPFRELNRLRSAPIYKKEEDGPVPSGGFTILGQEASSRELDISARFQPGTASRFGIKVRSDDRGAETVVGYDTTTGELFVDLRGLEDSSSTRNFRDDMLLHFPSTATGLLTYEFYWTGRPSKSLVE
jgi:fructan beta-fructosidase